MSGVLLASRRDALPEHTRYVDRGCDLSPSCLDCLFSACRYDKRLSKNDLRNLEVMRLRDEGMSTKDLMRRFGVCRRTVFRILARARR
jgi:CRP-like cAMP-binding protein